MIRKVIDYIKNESFEVKLDNNYVDVINYLMINYMEDDKILITYKDGSILIKGKNLTVVKLLDNEVLIKGNISSLEFRGINE